MALIFLISTIYFIFDGLLIFMEYQYVHDKLLDLILPIYICFSTFVLFEIKGVIIGSKETYDNLLYKLPVVLVNFNILKNISKFLQNVVVLDLIEHCKPVICFQIYSLAF